MSSGKGVRTSLIAWSVLLLTGGSVAAVPLDEASCAKLRDERVQLEKAGVRASMAQGPAWAAANLPSAQLKDIQRLIELDEQINFRCPQPVETAATNGSSSVPIPKRKPKANDAKVNDAYVPPPKRKSDVPAK